MKGPFGRKVGGFLSNCQEVMSGRLVQKAHAPAADRIARNPIPASGSARSGILGAQVGMMRSGNSSWLGFMCPVREPIDRQWSLAGQVDCQPARLRAALGLGLTEDNPPGHARL